MESKIVWDLMQQFQQQLQSQQGEINTNLGLLEKILSGCSENFSRGDAEIWEKRDALISALIAVNDYMIHCLPRTPTMIDIAYNAIEDAELGVLTHYSVQSLVRGEKAQAIPRRVAWQSQWLPWI